MPSDVLVITHVAGRHHMRRIMRSCSDKPVDSTQLAADFLLSDHSFGAFLRQIQRRDRTIPHFELLLESHSLIGNVTDSTIIASRSLP